MQSLSLTGGPRLRICPSWAAWCCAHTKVRRRLFLQMLVARTNEQMLTAQVSDASCTPRSTQTAPHPRQRGKCQLGHPLKLTDSYQEGKERPPARTFQDQASQPHLPQLGLFHLELLPHRLTRSFRFNY